MDPEWDSESDEDHPRRSRFERFMDGIEATITRSRSSSNSSAHRDDLRRRSSLTNLRDGASSDEDLFQCEDPEKSGRPSGSHAGSKHLDESKKDTQPKAPRQPNPRSHNPSSSLPSQFHQVHHQQVPEPPRSGGTTRQQQPLGINPKLNPPKPNTKPVEKARSMPLAWNPRNDVSLRTEQRPSQVHHPQSRTTARAHARPALQVEEAKRSGQVPQGFLHRPQNADRTAPIQPLQEPRPTPQKLIPLEITYQDGEKTVYGDPRGVHAVVTTEKLSLLPSGTSPGSGVQRGLNSTPSPQISRNPLPSTAARTTYPAAQNILQTMHSGNHTQNLHRGRMTGQRAKEDMVRELRDQGARGVHKLLDRLPNRKTQKPTQATQVQRNHNTSRIMTLEERHRLVREAFSDDWEPVSKTSKPTQATQPQHNRRPIDIGFGDIPIWLMIFLVVIFLLLYSIPW